MICERFTNQRKIHRAEDNLIEEFKLLRIHKIESLSRTLDQTLEELSKRSFENVSTKDLISIAFSIENKLRESVSRIECYTNFLPKLK